VEETPLLGISVLVLYWRWSKMLLYLVDPHVDGDWKADIKSLRNLRLKDPVEYGPPRDWKVVIKALRALRLKDPVEDESPGKEYPKVSPDYATVLCDRKGMFYNPYCKRYPSLVA
jgi:hypothetical protein